MASLNWQNCTCNYFFSQICIFQGEKRKKPMWGYADPRAWLLQPVHIQSPGRILPPAPPAWNPGHGCWVIDACGNNYSCLLTGEMKKMTIKDEKIQFRNSRLFSPLLGQSNVSLRFAKNCWSTKKNTMALIINSKLEYIQKYPKKHSTFSIVECSCIHQKASHPSKPSVGKRGLGCWVKI